MPVRFIMLRPPLKPAAEEKKGRTRKELCEVGGKERKGRGRGVLRRKEKRGIFRGSASGKKVWPFQFSEKEKKERRRELGRNLVPKP